MNLTRAEWRRIPKDYKVPRRGDEPPMALRNDPDRGTILEPVEFVCKHRRHEKILCPDCEREAL